MPYTDALLAPSDAPLAFLGCAILQSNSIIVEKMVDANLSTIFDFCVVQGNDSVEKAGYIGAVYFYT